MSATNYIDAVPDPGRTIEGLRDTGYTFVTAVADLIDNSIAADATNVRVQINQDFRGQLTLFVADDGFGMNRSDLVQAMKYGSPKRPDPASLGKYGLGLKTASTAFCRRLSLISRPSDNEPVLMATWDLDHVVREKKWSLQLSDEPDQDAHQHLKEVAAEGSGTVVMWSKVDRLLRNYKKPAGSFAKKALAKHVRELKQHIALTYQRFLDNEDSRARNITILLNGERVEGWDPFQIHLSELVAEETVRVEGTEASFSVRAFILPRRSEFPDDETAKKAKLSSNMQGLYIYREQRLIHHAGWLGMYLKEPHSTLLRVEFSFDHKLDDAFHLDIKKSQVILNEVIWNFLKEQFLSAPRREAQRRYRYGQNKDIANLAEDAHGPSNKSIRTKEAEVGGATVKITDPKTGEATVENLHGSFDIILKISSAAKPGEVFVQPAKDVADGLLFEPAIVDRHRAVRINTQHPYYHKVYVPNLSSSVTIQGMDSLLWALCIAEHSATTDSTAGAFADMRFEVSRILRKLVESLPDPDTGEDAKAT